MKKKLFISHASEDKDDFVRLLAQALSVDFDVWYDEHSLVIGCSLLEEISKGLANCDFGVVVLSKHFFAKNWTQQELNGLFALEEKDKKVILPVWKGVTKEEVMSYSPILVDRMAARAEDGVDRVVEEINRAVAYFERGRLIERPTSGLNKLRSSLEKNAEESRSEAIVRSETGVGIAMDTARQTVNVLANQVRSLREQSRGIRPRIDGPKDDGVGCRIDVWIGKICLHAGYINNVVNSAMDAIMNVAIIKAKLDYWGKITESRIYDQEKYSLFVDINNKGFWRAKTGQLFNPEDLVDKWLEKLSARIDNKRVNWK